MSTPNSHRSALSLRRVAALGLLSACALVSGCDKVWNDPYPASDRGQNILYTAFSERPKHLDPVQSYTSDEAEITAQVYEPPLQYAFLKEPYTLEPLTAAEMPQAKYLDASGKEVDRAALDVAFSVYVIHIKPGILYQPHPAFALDAQGRPRYLDMSREEVARHWTIADFKETGTRELTAADYAYQIKR